MPLPVSRLYAYFSLQILQFLLGGGGGAKIVLSPGVDTLVAPLITL